MAGKALSVTPTALRARASSPCAPTRADPVGTACCFTPQGPPPDRPDPAIYSQDEQVSLGAAPTWDSPDILTNYWNPFKLMPEATVTVRNLSGTVSAVNTQVMVWTSPFGVGQPRTAMNNQMVTLGPGQQTNLLFAFPQALLQAADQRIGFHVRLVHPTDSRTINNQGSQSIAAAYTSQAGRQIAVPFPVLNAAAATRQLHLSVLPNGLAASVTPAAPVLAPFEQVMASLMVHTPSTVHGTVAAPVRMDVTVVGRDGSGALIDGLTFVVWVDD